MPDEPRVVQNLPFKNSSEKFTSQQRLLRVDGFNHVLHAESWSNTAYKIFFSANQRNKARLGIISSKKILSMAVSRNFAKRMIREAFRRHPISNSKLDIIVMIKRGYNNKAVHKNSLIMLFDQVNR